MTRWLEMLLWFYFGETMCLRCGDAAFIRRPACRRCGQPFTREPERIKLGEALRRRTRPQWHP